MNKGITYLKATFAMLFWAITFVWIKVALETYRPYEIVLLRLILATVLLFAVMLITRHWERIRGRDLWQLMLVAFCEPFLYFVGEANGMQYVSSTLGSLVISTIPLVSAIGAWAILREKLTAWLIAGLLISFAGVAIMSMGSADMHATMKGIAFLLLAVFAGMFYAITVRRLTHIYSALTIVAWQSFFGMFYFLPLFVYYDWAHFSTVTHSLPGLATIVGMSVFASVGAFMLYTGVIRELGVIKSNVFTNLIPVFTVVLAYLILGDTLSPRSWLGLVLALTGLVISQLPDLKRLHRRIAKG